jgi:hypothetical protein
MKTIKDEITTLDKKQTKAITSIQNEINNIKSNTITRLQTDISNLTTSLNNINKNMSKK